MTTRETTVKNKTGLHARPASAFVEAASKFKSTIKIKNVDKNSAEVNAKSIIKLLTLSMSQGTTIRISATGEDEEEAVNALIELVDGGFGEL